MEEYCVKNIAKFKVTAIHSTPFICTSSHFIIEDNQVGQVIFFFMCPEVLSEVTHSMIFPGIVPWIVHSAFLKMDTTCVFL